MPYLHCNDCLHEFEAAPLLDNVITCDWCGSANLKELEARTPLEKMIKRFRENPDLIKEFNLIAKGQHKKNLR